ncbi:hypothetical protein IQ229_10415 [Nostoc cf. edaphicum LEGE 07299]|uniref:Uncharacterized protein n=1 Tax=Nostoc cf. edaphicum LEGE 07299 TaxID=2777974 RepID=A0ABR9TY38_9NOSO|nr:hypothetical protein [Nostoc edaphicum]MBE9105339.1 hypothetical protein [Nostoc cf. edaphicum LEGE 07299]
MTNCDAVPICYLGSDPFFGKRDGWLVSSLENRDSADGSSSDACGGKLRS